MRLRAETNGVLDRCSECESYAAFIEGKKEWAVQCCECANGTNVMRHKFEAMTAWNIDQRKSKKKSKETKKTKRIKKKI